MSAELRKAMWERQDAARRADIEERARTRYTAHYTHLAEGTVYGTIDEEFHTNERPTRETLPVPEGRVLDRILYVEDRGHYLLINGPDGIYRFDMDADGDEIREALHFGHGMAVRCLEHLSDRERDEWYDQQADKEGA